jgi:GT2 family glycosyltransferase
MVRPAPGSPPEAGGRPQVDVGVVTWNTASLTSRGLRRLLDTDQGCDLRLLVYDNASEDATPEVITAQVPEAEVIRGSENLGFARAVNRLLACSSAPWFFALNADAWPEEGAIGRLVRAAEEHPRSAAVAPRLVRPDGTLEHSTHPFPSVALAAVDAVGLRRLMPRAWAEEHCLHGAWGHDRPRRVDWAVGAALLLRRRAVDEIGGFDERFFLYVEDLDWCWRARQCGWDVWFEPSAVVYHVGNVSGARRFGERRAALEERNLRTFTSAALGRRRARAYHVLETAAVLRRHGAARLRGRTTEAEHWRLLARAALGLLPPPVALPPPESLAEGAPGAEPASAPGARTGPASDEPGAAPDVAVVVATRGRSTLLHRLLEALEKQDLPSERFEVIVVHDPSTDGTAEELARLSQVSTLRLRALHSAVPEGPAAKRNIGWRAATAPVVAFIDDDCVPEAHWLSAGLAALDGQPRIVVGRTTPPPEQRHLVGEPFARVLDVTSPRFFQTCNIFYRRRDLAAVGGFDERFRQPNGEDTQLGLRVVETGATPLFEPNALVYHDVRLGGARAARREARRWVDLPLVLKGRAYARRDLVHHWFFWKPSHPPAILALTGLLLSARWRAGLVLLGPWLHYRLRRDPVASARLLRLSSLPSALALDLTEVAVMVRGSCRHRTVLL